MCEKEKENENIDEVKVEVDSEKEIIAFKRKFRWMKVLKYAILHLCALYGLLLSVTTCTYFTLVFTFCLCYLSGLGLTAGAHRLWSHRAFKARWPFRLFLAFFNTMAFDDSIYNYAKQHRVHHKYAETNADPHNYNEGFVFSHYGWKMLTRHPEYLEKLAKQDLSDLMDDPFVRLQKKFWIPLVCICCFAIPTLIPYFCWNEDLVTAFCICGTTRWCIVSHAKATVNSLAHRWGQKPYDKNPGYACENKVVIWLAFGEGFHNFHHSFPYDYKQSELNWQYNMNLSAALVDFGALIGQTYDLRVASPQVIDQRRQRTGEPIPDDYINPKRRTAVEWIITIVLFFLPLGFWILCRYMFSIAFVHLFGFPSNKNFHNYVIDFVAQQLQPYALLLYHRLQNIFRNN